MSFCDEREACFDWFKKHYADKIDIAVLSPAFMDCALKAWNARAIIGARKPKFRHCYADCCVNNIIEDNECKILECRFKEREI